MTTMAISQAFFNLEGQIIAPQTPTSKMIVLPGHGPAGPECGNDIAMHCNHCGHTWVGKRSCMLRTCPNCWRAWARNEARASSLRLWSGIGMIAPRHGRRIIHAVVSFRSCGNYTEDRHRAVKIFKEHGLSGGIMLFHPFRQDDDGIFIPQDHIHYHVVALVWGSVSPSVPGLDYFFKFIRDADRGDYRGLKTMAECRRLIHYLLTHTGIVEGRHALTWWGELSYNQLSNGKLYEHYPGLQDQIERKPISRCPKCGSDDCEPDFIPDWTDNGRPDWVFTGT